MKTFPPLFQTYESYVERLITNADDLFVIIFLYEYFSPNFKENCFKTVGGDGGKITFINSFCFLKSFHARKGKVSANIWIFKKKKPS